jgi:hypothetical protein
MFQEKSVKRLREKAAAHVSALNQREFDSWYLQLGETPLIEGTRSERIPSKEFYVRISLISAWFMF